MQYPQQNGMQPGLQAGVSPYLMTVPASPHHSEQANHVLEELTGEQDINVGLDNSPMGQDSRDINAFGMDINEMPGILNMQDLCGALQIADVSPWPAADEEFLRRQHNHYLNKGLRTPSSLGSPPLSAAPTSVPSPRLVEADSNGSDYRDGSSEDARTQALEGDGATHILNVSQIKDQTRRGFKVPPHTALSKEMQKALLTNAIASVPQIETVQEPLALQNFMEAPCPASPSRVPPV